MSRSLAVVVPFLAAAFLAATGARSDVSVSLRELYAGKIDAWPAPTLLEGAEFTEFGPLPSPSIPDENPSTPEKVALGQRLFEDPRLSGSGQIACQSCHNRELGFGDGLKTSFGHDRTRGARNAPSVAVSGWMTTLFWDGRAASLEAQALVPIGHPGEMAADRATVEARLNADERYRTAFREVFDADHVTLERVADALAAFQRSLKPRRSKWDRVLTDGAGVLTDKELLGLHLFRTKAGCANCHSGPLFTDQKFHNIGLAFFGRELQDMGRYGVTGDPADVGAFRTPSLRNVATGEPYMHNGILPTLEGTVNFYNAGGAHPKPGPGQAADPLFPKTSALLRPLGLTAEEREALVAFLKTL